MLNKLRVFGKRPPPPHSRPSDEPTPVPSDAGAEAVLTDPAASDPGSGGSDDGERGLLANTSWLLASRLAQAVLGWGGTVLIARSLDLAEFGRFTIIFTVLGLMSIVTDMGIGRIAVRGMLGDPDREPEEFAGAYIALRMMLGLLGYVLMLAVVLVLHYPPEVVKASAVAGIVVVLATPSAALDVVFQARMRLNTVSLASVGGLTAQFALTAAIAAAGGTLLLFTIPAILCQVVILAWKWPAAHRLVKIRLRVDLALWRSLLKEAIPLTLGFGLATIYYRVDSVMLSMLDTFESVGIYGVSYKFIDIVHFAATAVTVPLLTLLVRAWPDDVPAFRDAVRRGAMLIAVLSGMALVGLLGFAADVTTLLYGAPYAVGEHATRVLVVAQVLTLFAQLALTCLVAVERHRQYPLVMLVGLGLNVGANFVLIPRFSYEGAAAATLASEVVVVSVLWWLLHRERSLWPLHLGRLVVMPIAVAVALVVGWAVDLVVPWEIAASAAVATFLVVSSLLGLTAAAGVDVAALVKRRMGRAA